MIDKITTANGKAFLLDSDSTQLASSVLKGTFIWMFATTVITIHPDGKRTKAYEYPSLLFTNNNLIRDENSYTRESANDIETELFNRIQRGRKLNPEIREYLRQSYPLTRIVDQRNQADDLVSE